LRMSIFIKEYQLNKFKDLEEPLDCIETFNDSISYHNIAKKVVFYKCF
jgi:hypothetical protein